ncbi:MAG TPA: hypothetical protein PKM43_07765 [Verrucomicrobiota bacterium]|nr:hypothetical protein [Verrucomicrobiota bacterium]HRZ58446.1 hypothetical protein [Candidatus Paceibacterota bacterium]
MRRQPIHIDRDKLRAAIRKLGNQHIFYMLSDAIDLLPPAKLHKIAKKYLHLERLRPDAEEATRSSLLADVKRFEKASLAGEYYESFDVNSRNCTEQSSGTSAWIAEHGRLLDRCVTDIKKSDPAEVREAMDILFGLLDHIDECNDDIVFFADEAGSWQVGVDWARVLPVWFKVLSATAGPEEFAGRITALLSNHYCYGRDKMLAIARRTATPDQRKALAQPTRKSVRS